MLHFFRRIRRNLLEGNQVRKYLLYAVGEILLVVIGILIALQINNWNTARFEAKELDGYLNNIAKNITADIARVQEMKQFRDSTIAYSEEVLALWRNKVMLEKEITEEDFSIYFPEDISIFYDKYFHSNESGFNALKSSGYLGKIQGTELESDLFEYYSLVQEISEQEYSLNEFIEDLQVIFYSKNIPQQIIQISEIPNKSTYFQQHQEELRALMNESTFTGANIRNAISPRILLPYYDRLVELGEKIIGSIREHT